jgi:hypothetical protein
MWDVLEHLADPVGELRLAREAVRDDGYLVVSTLRVDAWIARALGRRWPWYMRMHLVYFTPATIRAVLARAGWRLIALENYAHVVTLGYLTHKLGAYFPRASAKLAAVVERAGLAQRQVTIDLGDCLTAYAVKEEFAE